MGWKESKIGRKRRKKVDFDLSLLEGKARRRSIGLTPVRTKRKKNRTHIRCAIRQNAHMK